MDKNRDGGRETLFRQHEALAHFLARRMYEPESGDDLADSVQVALLGLMKAVDRFEPERGIRFSTFATPTILGELRRHYRDKTPRVKVPRHVQERFQLVRRTIDRLVQIQGRPPTVLEIAAFLGESEDSVLEALAAGEARLIQSLDAPAGTESVSSLHEVLGQGDPDLERVLAHADLLAAVRALSERDRTALLLRYFECQSQQAIAKALGISQMQVSRILRRALDQLKERLKQGS